MGVIDGHDVGALRRAIGEALERRSGRWSSTSTPSRARASRPPRRAASRGWRSGTRRSRSSIVNRKPAESKPAPVSETDSPEGIEKLETPPPAVAAAVHGGVRRRAGRRGQARPARDRDHRGDGGGDRASTSSRKEVPEQYYDVGIAEQDAVLFAAGLALQGAKPVCAIYSTFLQRGFDQIVHDVCLQKLNVVFAMDRAGPGRRRRPDPPRRLRHLLPAPASQHRPDGAARRGDARPHAAHRARPRRRPDRAALSARRRRGRAAAASRRREIPIGTGELLAEGERVALLGYGYGVQVALRGRRDPRRSTTSTSPSPTAGSPSRSTPSSCKRLAARARAARHDRGERPCRRLRRRRARAPRGHVHRAAVAGAA